VPISDQYGESLQRLHKASQVLVGPGPVKQRLCEAYLRHLKDIEAADLPLELATAFRELADGLCTAQAVGGLGAVEVSIRKMSESEAGQHAARVLDLLVSLSRRLSNEPLVATPRQLRLVRDE
jgi:hypothetical protein